MQSTFAKHIRKTQLRAQIAAHDRKTKIQSTIAPHNRNNTMRYMIAKPKCKTTIKKQQLTSSSCLIVFLKHFSEPPREQQKNIEKMHLMPHWRKSPREVDGTVIKSHWETDRLRLPLGRVLCSWGGLSVDSFIGLTPIKASCRSTQQDRLFDLGSTLPPVHGMSSDSIGFVGLSCLSYCRRKSKFSPNRALLKNAQWPLQFYVGKTNPKCLLFATSWGPGGFEDPKEACRNHFHLSWHLSDFTVPNSGKQKILGGLFCAYGIIAPKQTLFLNVWSHCIRANEL